MRQEKSQLWDGSEEALAKAVPCMYVRLEQVLLMPR